MRPMCPARQPRTQALRTATPVRQSPGPWGGSPRAGRTVRTASRRESGLPGRLLSRHSSATPSARVRWSELCEEYPVPRQSEEAYRPKKVRPVLRECDQYSQGAHGYAVSDLDTRPSMTLSNGFGDIFAFDRNGVRDTEIPASTAPRLVTVLTLNGPLTKSTDSAPVIENTLQPVSMIQYGCLKRHVPQRRSHLVLNRLHKCIRSGAHQQRQLTALAILGRDRTGIEPKQRIQWAESGQARPNQNEGHDPENG